MRTVLQIMDYAAPYKGNFIPSVENLEINLKQSGIRVLYMLPSGAKNYDWVQQLQSEGKKVCFIDRSFFSKRIKLKDIKVLLKTIKKERVTLIHTHFVAVNYTLAFMKGIFLRNMKIIGTFLNEYHPPFNNYRKFKTFITNNTFHTIIACSTAVKKSILNTGICSRKIRVVYNALDTKHLKVFSKINFTDNDQQKIILMFGYTFHRKGVDIAINAVKELIKEGQDIKLVIEMAGGMDIMEKEIIRLLGNIPDWIILKGPIHDVASYYNSADIFLSASREEGFTYSVLEAAYCNSMIIVSKIGGHPLDVPYVGKFESENVPELKSEIYKMLKKTPEEITDINKAQKEYVLKTYDINNWSKEIINIYSTI